MLIHSRLLLLVLFIRHMFLLLVFTAVHRRHASIAGAYGGVSDEDDERVVAVQEHGAEHHRMVTGGRKEKRIERQKNRRRRRRTRTPAWDALGTAAGRLAQSRRPGTRSAEPPGDARARSPLPPAPPPISRERGLLFFVDPCSIIEEEVEGISRILEDELNDIQRKSRNHKSRMLGPVGLICRLNKLVEGSRHN
ncbi:hypothetical protein EJB05_14177, partial [Eragrostis curvula]